MVVLEMVLFCLSGAWNFSSSSWLHLDKSEMEVLILLMALMMVDMLSS